MTPDKIIVTIVGIVGIIFTYWFFLAKNQKVTKVNTSEIDILVEGGYLPNTIEIPVFKKTTLRFIRKDSSTCLEEVVLPDFQVKKSLPLNTPVEIIVTPEVKGEFDYYCGMNMYHGKIIVS